MYICIYTHPELCLLVSRERVGELGVVSALPQIALTQSRLSRLYGLSDDDDGPQCPTHVGLHVQQLCMLPTINTTYTTNINCVVPISLFVICCDRFSSMCRRSPFATYDMVDDFDLLCAACVDTATPTVTNTQSEIVRPNKR